MLILTAGRKTWVPYRWECSWIAAVDHYLSHIAMAVVVFTEGKMQGNTLLPVHNLSWIAAVDHYLSHIAMAVVVFTEGKMQGNTLLPVHNQPACRQVHANDRIQYARGLLRGLSV